MITDANKLILVFVGLAKEHLIEEFCNLILVTFLQR